MSDLAVVALRGESQPRAAPCPAGRTSSDVVLAVGLAALAAFSVGEHRALTEAPSAEEVTHGGIILADCIPAVRPLIFLGYIAILIVLLSEICVGLAVIVNDELVVCIEPCVGAVVLPNLPHTAEGISHSDLVTVILQLLSSCSEGIPVLNKLLHLIRSLCTEVLLSEVGSVNIAARSGLPGSSLQNAVVVSTDGNGVVIAAVEIRLRETEVCERSGVLIVVDVVQNPVSLENEEVNVLVACEVVCILLASFAAGRTNVDILNLASVVRVSISKVLDHLLDIVAGPAEERQLVAGLSNLVLAGRSCLGRLLGALHRGLLRRLLRGLFGRLSNTGLSVSGVAGRITACIESGGCDCQSSNQSKGLLKLVHCKFPPSFCCENLLRSQRQKMFTRLRRV